MCEINNKKFEIIHTLYGFFGIDVILDGDNLKFFKDNKNINNCKIKEYNIDFNYLDTVYGFSINKDNNIGIIRVVDKNKELFCYYDGDRKSISFTKDNINSVNDNEREFYFNIENDHVSVEYLDNSIYFHRYGKYNEPKNTTVFDYRNKDYKLIVTSNDGINNSVEIVNSNGITRTFNCLYKELCTALLTSMNTKKIIYEVVEKIDSLFNNSKDIICDREVFNIIEDSNKDENIISVDCAYFLNNISDYKSNEVKKREKRK